MAGRRALHQVNADLAARRATSTAEAAARARRGGALVRAALAAARNGTPLPEPETPTKPTTAGLAPRYELTACARCYAPHEGLPATLCPRCSQTATSTNGES